MIRSIAHPTDFSPEGQVAFDHALALALHHRVRLDLLHVGAAEAATEWSRFPRVRERLIAWGRIPAETEADAVAGLTGVEVRKIELHGTQPGEVLGTFLRDHRPDLVVMASHARSGLARLVQGSVAAEVARDCGLAMLLVGPGATGLLDAASGALKVERVLVPVDHDPRPDAALQSLERILAGAGATTDLFHVGERAPAVHGYTVRLGAGGVVDAILAEGVGANLIAMPTAGRRGFLDALLGSTTERVLAAAKVPLLALPAA